MKLPDLQCLNILLADFKIIGNHVCPLPTATQNLGRDDIKTIILTNIILVGWWTTKCFTLFLSFVTKSVRQCIVVIPTL